MKIKNIIKLTNSIQKTLLQSDLEFMIKPQSMLVEYVDKKKYKSDDKQEQLNKISIELEVDFNNKIKN